MINGAEALCLIQGAAACGQLQARQPSHSLRSGELTWLRAYWKSFKLAGGWGRKCAPVRVWWAHTPQNNVADCRSLGLYRKST